MMRQARARAVPGGHRQFTRTRSRVGTLTAPPPVATAPLERNDARLVASTSFELDFWGRFGRADEAARANLLGSQHRARGGRPHHRRRHRADLFRPALARRADRGARQHHPPAPRVARHRAGARFRGPHARARRAPGAGRAVRCAGAAARGRPPARAARAATRAVIGKTRSEGGGRRSLRVASPAHPARRPALQPARAPARHPRRRADHDGRQRADRRGARGALPVGDPHRLPRRAERRGRRHRQQRRMGTGASACLAPLFDAGRREASRGPSRARATNRRSRSGNARWKARSAKSPTRSSTSRRPARREADLLARVQAARNALELSRIRYESGYSPYLEVLDAQRTANDAEIAFVRNRQARLAFSVDLMRALGGRLEPN